MLKNRWRVSAAALVLLRLAVPRVLAAESRVVLAGHIAPQIKASTRIGPAPNDENVSLSLVLKLDQDLLDKTLADIYAQPLSQRHYLTPSEFAQKFDFATKRQKLKDFALTNGLTLSAEDEPNSMVVKVSGTVDRVQKAFGVQLNHYQKADGQIFRAHETEPLIPADLTPHLIAVMGLSNVRGVYHPHGRISPRNMAAPAALTNTTGLGGDMSPADIKTVYLPGLSNTLNGTGQTLGLYEGDGYNPQDIAAYENQYGLTSPTLTFVPVDGQQNLCSQTQDQPCNQNTYNQEIGANYFGMLEVAADIELMAALAPKASQIYVYTSVNNFLNIIDAYDKMATDGIATAISTSWGAGEDLVQGANMTAENNAFQRMATQGQSFYSAAGDEGAYTDGGTTKLMTDDPASQPFAVGVGGTILNGTVGGAVTETVWNDGVQNGNYSAGGGGIANYTENGGASKYWTIPNYQVGVAGTASQVFRNVPDVTLNARFPYSVCAGGTGPANCNNSGFIGTSAAAPLWAGFTALVNQQLAINGQQPLGFPHSQFYSIAKGPNYGNAFNDITSGNNGFYNAGAGYDNASGLGSFKTGLINLLSTPNGNFVGAGGGTLSLPNAGPGPIQLQVPAGALSGTTLVTLSTTTVFRGPNLVYPVAPSPAATLTPTGVGVQITLNPALQPSQNATLSIGYRVGDVTGLNAQQLIIARYDAGQNVWVPLPSSVDTVGRTVVGITSHFSLFQIMQSVPSNSAASLIAFPNPWRVSQGPASMTFSNGPAGARLRIYTLSGLLVKDLSLNASGSASWDGTNQSGQPAASGFYFGYVQGGGTHTLKLAIQR